MDEQMDKPFEILVDNRCTRWFICTKQDGTIDDIVGIGKQLGLIE